MIRNLILSGGIFHDFEGSSRALAGILEAVGVQSEIEDDVERGLARLAGSPVDLLTVNALRWEMAGDKYDAFREREALCLSEAGRAAIEGHVERGGALLGIHTASICFSDWAGWSAVLGGAWRWGQSWHPAPGPVALTPVAHPLTRGIEPFELDDELYSRLDLEPGIEPLLTATAPGVDAPQPVLWLHRFGRGRVVYDALGHEAESFAEPAHRALLLSAVRWSLEQSGEVAHATA